MIFPFLPLFTVRSLYLCSHPPHFSLYYFYFLTVSSVPHYLLLSPYFPIIFLITFSLFLFKMSGKSCCYIVQSVLVSVSLFIHSSLTYSCYPSFSLQDSSGMRLWKRKWFVLADFCLFYYKGTSV